MIPYKKIKAISRQMDFQGRWVPGGGNIIRQDCVYSLVRLISPNLTYDLKKNERFWIILEEGPWPDRRALYLAREEDVIL